MRTIMTSAAFAALLAASPAFAGGGQWQQLAQADQQPAQTEDLQAAPACPEGQTCPEQDATGTQGQPATTGSIQPAPDATDSAQAKQPADATSQMAAEQPAGKFFDEQGDDQVLASELMGKTVYDSADESLGDINDVIWAEDGTIKGVVVGVGGFLGIGEKNVAVNYEALNISTDQFGDKKLVLDATSDELAAAPEFVTQAQKLAELRAQQPPAAGDAGGLAPAPLPQPAQTQ